MRPTIGSVNYIASVTDEPLMETPIKSTIAALHAQKMMMASGKVISANLHPFRFNEQHQ